MGNRKYDLSSIWVNPCQTRVPSMEEAVKELTAWVSSGPNWPYALVWLNKDTCHVPLPKEGHLGILPKGGTDRTTCRRISQLEVHQVLVSGLQVTYPVGLNGCKDPIITSLPESLANGISLTGGRSVYLEVNIPQPIMEEPDQKALPLGRCSPILMASPLKTTPPKPEWEVSMTMELRSLLSWVMLDTSGHVLGTQPQKTKPCGHTHTSTPQTERSLQVGGHIIPGEYSGWCWDGRSLSRGSPHHHLSHSCTWRAQQWHPSHRHKLSLREGQQGPRGAADHKVIHQCL